MSPLFCFKPFLPTDAYRGMCIHEILLQHRKVNFKWFFEKNKLLSVLVILTKLANFFKLQFTSILPIIRSQRPFVCRRERPCCLFYCEWINKWMSEWVNEWSNERRKEGRKEGIWQTKLDTNTSLKINGMHQNNLQWEIVACLRKCLKLAILSEISEGF